MQFLIEASKSNLNQRPSIARRFCELGSLGGRVLALVLEIDSKPTPGAFVGARLGSALMVLDTNRAAEVAAVCLLFSDKCHVASTIFNPVSFNLAFPLFVQLALHETHCFTEDPTPMVVTLTTDFDERVVYCWMHGFGGSIMTFLNTIFSGICGEQWQFVHLFQSDTGGVK